MREGRQLSMVLTAKPGAVKKPAAAPSEEPQAAAAARADAEGGQEARERAAQAQPAGES
jgi:hypothetical protein